MVQSKKGYMDYLKILLQKMLLANKDDVENMLNPIFTRILGYAKKGDFLNPGGYHTAMNFLVDFCKIPEVNRFFFNSPFFFSKDLIKTGP